MKDNKIKNIEEALQTISKLELLLKMTGIEGRDIDLLTDKLWKKWKSLNNEK